MHRKDINRGPKEELERLNVVDAELGLLKWNEHGRCWLKSNPVTYRIDVLVIGQTDVAHNFILSLKDAQLKKFGTPEQADADCLLERIADRSAEIETTPTSVQYEESLDGSFTKRRLEAQEASKDLVAELWAMTNSCAATDRAITNDVDSIAQS